MIEWRLDWTEEQWDDFENRSIAVNLSLFDQLVTATRCLSEGRRPGKNHKWADVVERAEARLAKATAKI